MTDADGGATPADGDPVDPTDPFGVGAFIRRQREQAEITRRYREGVAKVDDLLARDDQG